MTTDARAAEPINLAAKLGRFSDLWSPKIVAQMNDYHLKLAKVRGEFVWHSHADTDEVFLVLEGNLEIGLRDGAVSLGPGDLYVVPRGVEHQPRAEAECAVLLIEPAGTVNTGDAGGEFTADTEWI